jgi:hypothetical protein
MIILSTSSDKLQITTETTGTTEIFCSYIDATGTTVTPNRKNLIITSGTTTDFLLGPSSGTRNVKSLFIKNTSTTLYNRITVSHYNGSITSDLTSMLLAPGAELHYLSTTGFKIKDSGNPETPTWYGNIYGTHGSCDPQQQMRAATMFGTVAATPTNIGATVARISYFIPPADIVVNRVRFYGVGATTAIYTISIYDGDTLVRLTPSTTITTAANAWGSVFATLNLTLTKGQLYFVAISANAVGTTAGMLCAGATTTTTTGTVGIIPTSWPGGLAIKDKKLSGGGFAQFAVTAGAMPTPAATITAMAAWTGGFPLLFLDNNDAA